MQSWVHAAVLCLLVLYLVAIIFRLLGIWPFSGGRCMIPISVVPPVEAAPMVTHGGIEEYQYAAGSPPERTQVLQFSEIRDAARQQQAVGPKSEARPTINERFQSAKKPVPEDRLTKGVLSQKQRIERLNIMIRRPETAAKRRQWRDEFRDYFRGDPVPTHRKEELRLRNDGEPLPGALSCHDDVGKWGGSNSTPVGGGNEPEEDAVFMQS